MTIAHLPRPGHLGRALLPLLAVTALGVTACGSTTPATPAPTSAPAQTAKPASSSTPAASPTSASIALSAAVLASADFSSGATDQASSDVPDLTSVKCTPNQTSGLQQQYKSEVTAASGRIYGNVVAGFDNSTDAHSFITSFNSGAGSCADASTQPIQDNYGDYSFYFQIKGSPNDLRVEAVQVGNLLTLVIQVLPSGTQPDQQSLRDLTQVSVGKLQRVSS